MTNARVDHPQVSGGRDGDASRDASRDAGGPSKLHRHLAAKVGKRRKALGLSRDQVDLALGWSEGYCQALEEGARAVSVADLAGLTQVFTIGMDYFFDGAEDLASDADEPDEELLSRDEALTRLSEMLEDR